MRLRLAAFLVLLIGGLLVLSGASTASAEGQQDQGGQQGQTQADGQQDGEQGGQQDDGPAAPQGDPDALNVVGNLLDDRTDPPTPVEGVTITVSDAEGELATGESDADGRFAIPLPGDPIDYLGDEITVALDTDTLPDESALREAGTEELTFPISTDQNIAVNYSIGPDPNAVSWWVEPTSAVINGLVIGLIIALASLGLSLVFGTTGLTNFAHGELFTFGAIMAFALNSVGGLHILIAAPIAVVLSGVFGYVQDRGLWGPLRRRGTGLIAMMIVSIGLSILLRNVFQYFVGGDAQQYDQYATVESWQFGDLNISPKDALAALICLVVLIGVSVAVQNTRFGKAIRAVADNPPLAASSGINVDRVITLVWIVGTALAGLGGILYGLTQGFDYQTGFKLLLLIFAATTLGGLGTIWGAMAGSLIVGLLQELSTIFGVPAELKIVVPLFILIIVLLVRPQGLLGRRERVG